jgi:diguanylate cyclase (GGDEF)-like protein/PAS domain S-box-containing protein
MVELVYPIVGFMDRSTTLLDEVMGIARRSSHDDPYIQLVDAVSDPVVVIDDTGRVVHVNPEAAAHLEEPGAERLLEAGSLDFEIATCRWQDGDRQLAAVVLRSAARSVIDPLGPSLVEMLESGCDYYVVFDADGGVILASERLRNLLATTSDKTSARGILDLLTSESRGVLETSAIDALRREGRWRGELVMSLPDGSSVSLMTTLRAHQSDGHPCFYSAVAHDVTEFKRTEVTLVHAALHDPLTGLPNRLLYRELLEHAIRRRESAHRFAAVMFVDLDRFKLVNDTLGHEVGDEYLCIVARRLQGAVRGEDVVARFGGDEFCVLSECVSDEIDALAVANRLLAAIEEPVQLGSLTLSGTASIGIALGRAGDDASEVLRNADIALYRAKEGGRNRAQLYDEHMRSEYKHRLQLEHELRQAIRNRELHCLYQPVMDLGKPRVVGVEALVRWRRGPDELVGPSEFIAVAEETGLIVPIGYQVLEDALSRAVGWRSELGDSAPIVSVNLSARQFNQPDLLDKIRGLIGDLGASPTDLCLEITESALLNDVTDGTSTIQSLRSLGVQVAIDDFGTGQSSLTHLRRLPVSAIKIDHSFVDEVDREDAGTMIVASVINLAHALGMTVVGEGLERIEQLVSLQGLGCDLGQGYLFSPPVDADEIELLVRNPRCSRVEAPRASSRLGGLSLSRVG